MRVQISALLPYKTVNPNRERLCANLTIERGPVALTKGPRLTPAGKERGNQKKGKHNMENTTRDSDNTTDDTTSANNSLGKAEKIFRTKPPSIRPQIGDPYNSYMMFIGAFIPNWLLRRAEISPGGKLCYARLMQHSGKDCRCIPSAATLAGELAVSEGSVRKYLAELRDARLISSQQRGLGRSNTYQTLWHEWIEEAHEAYEAHETQKAALAEQGQPYIHLDESGQLVGDVQLLTDKVVELIGSEYGLSFFSQEEWEEAIAPGISLALRDQARFHAVHGGPAAKEGNLYPKLLKYLVKRYTKPEGMPEELPIDSLLRIDMTCGRVDSCFPVVGLRPSGKKESQEFMKTCRAFHDLLDRCELTTREYLEWCEGEKLPNIVGFADILSIKLFKLFRNEKLAARNVLKPRAHSEAAL